ncbi:glycosyltransferase family 4 protein [uncultured Adlercreutzia sp.]|uniref:glycosyltransferase family 4 protein n=1 Tax=uncultured Adlercreutzia sp. TaxID=875803 RepID=UPI0025E59148|nr:glycosyltransferase family 4 protein [uncultured Adlercreutzia sp.]
MKIAVVSAYTQSHAGIRAELIQSFIDRGHEVVAFGGESEENWIDFFAARKVSYRQFSVNRTGVNPIQDIKTIASLERLYSEEKPDKVFTYHAKGNIYGCLAAQRAGLNDVYSLVAGLGTIFRDDPDKINIIRSIMTMEYRAALRGATAVFFQNNDDKALFVDRGIVEPSKTVIVNGSGVDLGRFPWTPLPESPSFLFVGRLIKDKGILEFIEAARIVKRYYPLVRFQIVGDVDDNPTSLSRSLIDSIAEEGIVEFAGPQSNVVPFYQRSSVFVLPSHHEGTPRSALEALAVGRPVILTDAPGCREVVQNGENGFMIPVGDPKSLAEVMIRFIEQPTLAVAMGQKSRVIAEEKYDVRKVNEAICNTMGL